MSKKRNFQSKSWQEDISRFSQHDHKKHQKKESSFPVHKHGSERKRQSTNYATAPYNFVPLNESVIPAESPHPGDKDFSLNRYYEDRNTGYIQLKITTESPLYIRDALNETELAEKQRLEEDEKKNKASKTYINSDFFSPAGRKRIPGSSIRGMIRTLVEIMSYSRIDFINKKDKFYYRALGERSLKLKKTYENKMVGHTQEKGYAPKVKAGYLIKKEQNFQIIPAQEIYGCQYFRVEEDRVVQENIIPYKIKDSKYVIGFKSIFFKPEKPKIQNEKHRFPLFYADVLNVSANKMETGQEGTLVYTGWGPGGREGKHMHWIISPPVKNTAFQIADEVIENHKNDSLRAEDCDILEYFRNKPQAKVPCFFIEENGKIQAFGHTAFFRLPYKYSLGDLLPEEMKKHHYFDITTSIFGNETDFAGRVFFEDALLEEDNENELLKESIPEILGSPKPTDFPHYLEQDESAISPAYNQRGKIRGYHGIKDYNDKTWLRGWKLYWHKSDGQNWQAKIVEFDSNKYDLILKKLNLSSDELDYAQETNNKKGKKAIIIDKLTQDHKRIILKAIGIYKTQYTRILPVKTGANFTGKIRFENLSDVELGALLFSLDLPQECRHKLGMGKPLGLGSIRISPQLYISDRKQRYLNLLEEWKNGLQEIQKSDSEFESFKNKFQTYVLEKLGKTSASNLWELQRMKELKRLLAFLIGDSPDGRPHDKNTQYLSLQEFKNRKVLPNATKV